MSLAHLAANVLDNITLDHIPEHTTQTFTSYEVWQHSPDGWLYLIDYANKQHADEHVGSLNATPYHRKKGRTYHVIEVESQMKTRRKQLNP